MALVPPAQRKEFCLLRAAIAEPPVSERDIGSICLATSDPCLSEKLQFHNGAPRHRDGIEGL